METITIQLPSSDTHLLKELAKKLGWITKNDNVAQKKISELDLALKDIEDGRVETFDSVDELMKYLDS